MYNKRVEGKGIVANIEIKSNQIQRIMRREPASMTDYNILKTNYQLIAISIRISKFRVYKMSSFPTYINKHPYPGSIPRKLSGAVIITGF